MSKLHKRSREMGADNAPELNTIASASPEIEYAPWSDWQAESYLEEYYSSVMPDEAFAMEFLVDSMRQVPDVSVALDFGCGPTVHHLFPIVEKTAEIHLAEYLEGNRLEVERWLDGTSQHDWLPFALE